MIVEEENMDRLSGRFEGCHYALHTCFGDARIHAWPRLTTSNITPTEIIGPINMIIPWPPNMELNFSLTHFPSYASAAHLWSL
jgi:hypothetical protein